MNIGTLTETVTVTLDLQENKFNLDIFFILDPNSFKYIDVTKKHLKTLVRELDIFAPDDYGFPLILTEESCIESENVYKTFYYLNCAIMTGLINSLTGYGLSEKEIPVITGTNMYDPDRIVDLQFQFHLTYMEN